MAGAKTDKTVSTPPPRTAIVAALAVTLALVAVGVTAAAPRPPEPVLLSLGIAESPCSASPVTQVPVTATARFDPGSSVLRGTGSAAQPDDSGVLAGGQGAASRGFELVSGRAACVAAAEQASRGWLRDGLVPGTGPRQRAMARRALLDLRLLVRPDGAVLAATRPAWRYAWPRDSSWVAVALADSGHLGLSLRILRFLQRTQSPAGTWAARYRPSGSGPVRDGRPSELDAVGWVPWAAWAWMRAALGHGDAVRPALRALYPMVAAAAGAAERSLARDGLPAAAMDYWETTPLAVTLGTAAPLLAGLRAAAAVAGQLGDDSGESRWAGAAARLAAGIDRGFARHGFHRVAYAGSGDDAAITFLGPPFAAPSRAVLRAADFAEDALRVPNGGLRPGTGWTGAPGVAWTPETAFFALFDAGTGRTGESDRLLDWLAVHRTGLGELPEQVGPSGTPASVAPLAWTDAIVLLAMLEQRHLVPEIPAG